MFDSTLLNGKVALVTMSTFGIGAATVRQLAGSGIDAVVLNGRNPEKGQALEAELRDAYPKTRFLFVSADIMDSDSIAMLFERIVAEFGGLDIMVHSGTAPGHPDIFSKTSPDTYQPLIDGFYFSLVRCCYHAVPLMAARGGGSIVAVTSDAARVPTPGESVIGGAFAASVQFLRALALEIARDKIRANVIAPSLVRDTQGYNRVMADGFSKKLFENIKQRAEKRLGLPGPENIAPLAVFLASALSSHITGQVITVNGGLSG